MSDQPSLKAALAWADYRRITNGPFPANTDGEALCTLAAAVRAARSVLDTAIEHTDEFGAVMVRVEPLAYEAWQEQNHD